MTALPPMLQAQQPMSEADLGRFKRAKAAIIAAYANGNDAIAAWHVASTLLPIAALWVFIARADATSHWFSVVATAALVLFLLRAFVLLHECGHGSLFRTQALNRAFGFVFGVTTGMPQQVWSDHHAYHHATNGNWSKYRGPLATLSVAEFSALSRLRRFWYVACRSVWLAPLGGLMYLFLAQRYVFLVGNWRLLRFVMKAKQQNPGASWHVLAKPFKIYYWKDARQYWCMFANNVTLLAAMLAMAVTLGPALFFSVYFASLALAGAAGLILFTVQHNFPHAYAASDTHWDYDRGALEGSSHLTLPAWLNWFTANIAWHHIHHLSASIPHWRLARCHDANPQWFVGVRRLKLTQIPAALKNILWDEEAQCIITPTEAGYRAFFSAKLLRPQP